MDSQYCNAKPYKGVGTLERLKAGVNLLFFRIFLRFKKVQFWFEVYGKGHHFDKN